MIRKTISLVALVAVLAGPVSARVNTAIPAVLAEGTILNLKGTSFNTEAQPLAASFKTADGTTTTLDTTVVSNSQLKVKIPTVSADTKGVLRISGGNVLAAKPQEYSILILNEVTAAFVTPLNGDDLIAVPSTVTTSTQAATADSATTVTGANQTNITGIGAVTTVGGVGKTTTFPGSISVASGITGTLSTASQPNVTTLAGLTAAGTAGANTLFAGTVQATQGFIGNITGNVTGNVTGTVTGNALTGFSASAGTVSASDTILVGFNKLAGTLNNAASAATSSVIVKRDSNGDFAAGDITSNGQVIATTFNGTAESAVAGVTDIATAKEINDSATVAISSATLIKVTDADNNDNLSLITGGRTGQYLTILFDDTITVVDDDVATAANAIDIVDVANNNETFGAGDILTLIFDGTSWHEVSRSINATGD